MKTVLSLYGGDSDFKTSTPPKDKKYRECYEYMYELAKKHGVRLVRASNSWYDEKKRVFKHAWTYEKEKGWFTIGETKPDLVWDKMNASTENDEFRFVIAKAFKIINDPLFAQTINNKFLSSLFFKEFIPQTIYLDKTTDVKNVAKKIKSDKIVFKPLTKSGGSGIIIVKHNEIAKIKINDPYLAQEFIETDGGIKNITNDRHDLRLTFVNEKLIYAYIRTPAKGKLLANVSQGGSMAIVPIDKLPESIKPILKLNEKLFADFNPRIYTIDLMFGPKQKPYVVEMNARPGVYFYPDQKRWQDRFYMAMIDVFKE